MTFARDTTTDSKDVPTSAPTWPTTSIPPVHPARFGSDHWSTFAYVETRIVDHRGVLNPVHLRLDPDRHPVMSTAKRALTYAGSKKYPTRVRGGEIHDHDDLDCLDDLVAAGLLTVSMPPFEHGAFRDVHGRAIPGQGSIVTGLTEASLARHAMWSLTPKGAAVAAALRDHKANGGNFARFTPDPVFGLAD